ncbi:MAG: hypothetical protein HYW38_02360 [Candidatus Colwellbacteria bacterium]|nr:hypothetical protein [Candidatus Colwellbacteria bacterium]
MNKILDLDSKSAVTIFSLVTIPHDNPRQELGLTDLENYISQAIWKIFDQCRNEAAQRLEVDGADLLLTDARVMEIRIDGHPVINPHGFTGSKMDVTLSITMVKRDKFIEEANIILEGGTVRAHLLAKRENLEDAVYIEVKEDTTTVFRITPGKIAYLSEFDWGEKKLTKLLKEELGLADDDSAKHIHLRYTEGNLSERAVKKIEKIFYSAFVTFINGGVMTFKNFLKPRVGSLPPIYLKSFFPLPESAYRKRFTFGDRKIRFLNANNGLALEDFVNDSTHSTYSELNQLAKRRIKWLMPTS